MLPWITLIALPCCLGPGCARLPAGPPRTVLPAQVPAGEMVPTNAARCLTGRWPDAYRIVQRAVITVGRKQYVADGVLTCAPETGLRLAVVSPLGLVTEVTCTPNGPGEVARVTPLFPERWARDYVARDLVWLFQQVQHPTPAGLLEDGRKVLEVGTEAARRRFFLSADDSRVEELEVLARGRLVYRAQFGRWSQSDHWPVPLPSSIRVDAGAYRLDLQIVQWDVTHAPPPPRP